MLEAIEIRNSTKQTIVVSTYASMDVDPAQRIKVHKIEPGENYVFFTAHLESIVWSRK